MKKIHRHRSDDRPRRSFFDSKEFRDRCDKFVERMRRRGTFGRESSTLDFGDDHPLKLHHTWVEVRGNGMAPRYLDGEAALLNLDAVRAMRHGSCGIVAWKAHPEPIVRRAFNDRGKVVLVAFGTGEVTVLGEREMLFFCPVIRSEIDHWGTAMAIRHDRKEISKTRQKFFRIVDTELKT